MAKFHQQVKTIIADIETFLTVSSKDSKLTRQALTQKASILNQIAELREEYPQLAGSVTDDRRTQETPTATVESDDDQNIYECTDFDKPEDESAKELPANDETNVTKSGQLRLRKEKKATFLSKLSKKPWCVLRGKDFCVYDKKTSKKPAETFSTEGYTATSLEDASKKDFSFELTCDGKKSYIFEAVGGADDLKEWLRCFNPVPLRNRPDTLQDGYYDEDNNKERISEILYEDAEVSKPTSSTPPPLPASSGKGGRRAAPNPGSPGSDSSPSPSGESMTPGNPDDGQELYDETVLPPSLPDRGKPQENQDDQDIYDDTEFIPEDIQEDPKLQSPPQLPARPDENRDTPPPPPPKKTPIPAVPQSTPALPAPPHQNTAEPDYPNMYYGMWDCAGGQDKELSFKKGDVIKVISKKYEEKGWLVGRLDDKIGLVPRNYLSEAFERA